MVNVRQPRDVAQILLSVLFLAIMIVACLWIVQPFILGFAWAGTVVIATWPVLLRLQKIMFGRRSLAVLVMTCLLCTSGTPNCSNAASTSLLKKAFAPVCCTCLLYTSGYGWLTEQQ